MESDVYDHALSACATGIKLFTSFTNKWKGRVKETAPLFEASPRVDAMLSVDLASSQKGRRVSISPAVQYKPSLPLPSNTSTDRRIVFVRPISRIDRLSEHLFNEARSASEVGAECFDRIYLVYQRASK